MKIQRMAISDLTTTLRVAADEGAAKTCQGYLGKSEADLSALVKGGLEREETNGDTRLKWVYRVSARTEEIRLGPRGMVKNVVHVPAMVTTTEAVMRDGWCVFASVVTLDDEGSRSVRWSGHAPMTQAEKDRGAFEQRRASTFHLRPQIGISKP